MSYDLLSRPYTNLKYKSHPNWADPCNPCEPFAPTFNPSYCGNNCANGINGRPGGCQPPRCGSDGIPTYGPPIGPPFSCPPCPPCPPCLPCPPCFLPPVCPPYPIPYPGQHMPGPIPAPIIRKKKCSKKKKKCCKKKCHSNVIKISGGGEKACINLGPVEKCDCDECCGRSKPKRRKIKGPKQILLDPCYHPWVENWPYVTRSWTGSFTN